MEGLVEFSIPIKGLGDGIHRFDFHIDQSFFKHFENAPVEEGDIDLTFTLDKSPSMYVLEFDFEGTVKTACDRCLATIDLPISGSQQLLVKFSYEEQDEEAEVIYISPETKKLDVSKYIYEFVVLAIPMIKVYDCQEDENPPCNFDMLRYLEATEEAPPMEKKVEDNPIWDELRKKLSKDN